MDTAIGFAREGEVVRDDHNGFFIDIHNMTQNIDDMGARRRIEIAGWLIGENDRGLIGERTRDRHTLTLAA